MRARGSGMGEGVSDRRQLYSKPGGKGGVRFMEMYGGIERTAEEWEVYLRVLWRVTFDL